MSIDIACRRFLRDADDDELLVPRWLDGRRGRHPASLSDLVRTIATVTRTRSSQLGPAARPVAVPEDIDEPGIHKVEGKVTLPLHVRWSGQPKTYDLAKRVDRVRVYEQVLREGDELDVRSFIDVDELLALWDELVLPAHVRQAWAQWFRRHRGVDVAC